MILEWLYSGKKNQCQLGLQQVNCPNDMESVCITFYTSREKGNASLFQMDNFTVIFFRNSDYIWVLHYGCNEAGIYCLNNRSKQIRK